MNKTGELSTCVFTEKYFLRNLFNIYLLIFLLQDKSPICFQSFFLFNKQNYKMEYLDFQYISLEFDFYSR